jgi:hypothetical protein
MVVMQIEYSRVRDYGNQRDLPSIITFYEPLHGASTIYAHGIDRAACQKFTFSHSLAAEQPLAS